MEMLQNGVKTHHHLFSQEFTTFACDDPFKTINYEITSRGQIKYFQYFEDSSFMILLMFQNKSVLFHDAINQQKPTKLLLSFKGRRRRRQTNNPQLSLN